MGREWNDAPDYDADMPGRGEAIAKWVADHRERLKRKAMWFGEPPAWTAGIIAEFEAAAVKGGEQ